MRYLFAIIVLVALVLAYYVWGPNAKRANSAQAKNMSSGVITYGNDTLASLHVNGFVTLEGTYIRKALLVNGKLEADSAHIGSVKVNGMADVKNSIVDGMTLINGYLNAKNSTFQKEVKVAAQKVHFEGCTLDSVVIPEVSWSFGSQFFGPQIVELDNKTVCKGNITFESGKGKVIASADSQILGTVVGAEVEKK